GSPPSASYPSSVNGANVGSGVAVGVAPPGGPPGDVPEPAPVPDREPDGPPEPEPASESGPAEVPGAPDAEPTPGTRATPEGTGAGPPRVARTVSGSAPAPDGPPYERGSAATASSQMPATTTTPI